MTMSGLLFGQYFRWLADRRRLHEEALALFARIEADSLMLYRMGYVTEEVAACIVSKMLEEASADNPETCRLYRNMPGIVASMHPGYAARRSG